MAAITLTTDLPELPGALALIDRPSRPDPSQQVAARVLQINLRSDPPGYGLANRYQQTDSNVDVVALATKAYMDSIGAARFVLLERTGTVRKSLGGVGNYSRDDEYEPADPDHPLARVLEMPGGEDGVWSMGQECVYLTLQHMLTGDAPVWTPCNAAGRPVQFYSLTSALTQLVTGYGGSAQYPRGAWRVTPYAGTSGFFAGGAMLASAILPGEEVARFKEPHPWSRSWGQSRLESGAREIDVLNAITQSRWSAFLNKAQLDTLVMIPGASDDAVRAFYENFNARMAGPSNAGRVLVVAPPATGGESKATVSQIGPPVPEMGYANSYEQQAGTVLAMFRVPRGIAGFTSQTSYAQHYAELQQFYDLGLQPYARNLSVFLTQTLARPWSRFPGQFKIEVEIPAPKNLEAEASERQFALTNNVLAVNEYRKATGRRPVEGGDVPLVVWTGKAQQSVQPPEPPLGAAPEGGGDPLAALLGGDQPTAGAPPKPANPDGAGSLPPQVQKAQYQGRDVTLNKPFRLPGGSSKKFGVYVKDGGAVRKITFGDPNMEIKRDSPGRKKNFRARHNCATAKDKTSARYWSCRMWKALPPDLTDADADELDAVLKAMSSCDGPAGGALVPPAQFGRKRKKKRQLVDKVLRALGGE